MIKAYFFDMMKTLMDYKDVVDFKEILTKEQRNKLLIARNLESLELGEYRTRTLHNALDSTRFTIYDDTREILKKLKSENSKLALISNVYCTTNKKVRKLFPEFIGLFDVVTFSSEIGFKKPDLEIFSYTLKKINEFGEQIISSEVVMIGNSQEEDINPALSLGMQARLIDRTKQNLKDVI
ncbi:MAG: HAD-IA family hydrolase [Nanoarchaeota archaeon]